MDDASSAQSPVTAIRASAGSLPKGSPTSAVGCSSPNHNLALCLIYDDPDRTPAGLVPFIATFDDGSTRSGRLDAKGEAQLANVPPGPVRVQYGDEADDLEQKAQILRRDFRSLLDQTLQEMRQARRFEEENWQEYNALQKVMIYTGAFMTGVGEAAVGTVELIAAAGEFLRQAGLEYMDIIQCLMTGDYAELEAKMARARAKGSELYEAGSEQSETIILLLSDADTRTALRDFAKGYLDALSSVELTRMGGGAAFDIIVGLIITVATGGAGGVAAASNAMAKLGRHGGQLVAKLSDLAKVLKKMRTRVKRSAVTSTPDAPPAPPAANVHRIDKPRDAGTTTQPGRTDNGLCAPGNGKTCTEGEPISQVSGEELLELTDFVLPGPLPLAWTRTYRTGHSRDGGLGHGWTLFLTESLRVGRLDVDYWNREGRTITFPLPMPGQFSENLTEGLTLTRLSQDCFRIATATGPATEFRPVRGMWRPVALVDRFDNRWNIRYEDRDSLKPVLGPLLPSSLESSWGTRLQLVQENGHLVAVEQIVEIAAAGGAATSPHVMRHATYEFDLANDLTSAFDAEGHREQYAYHNHVITCRTLKTGFNFHFAWDRHDIHGRCLRQWGDRGIYDYRFQWDTSNRQTLATDSNGGVKVTEYNEAGLPVREVDPEGGVTLSEYDESGLLVKRTDPNGNVTQYVYDERRRLIRLQDPAGNLHQIAYDPYDRPIAVTDPAASKWEREYDDLGALTSVSDPDGNRTEIIYNQLGLPSIIRDPLGQERQLIWNQKGELEAERLSNGLAIKYRYDALSRIVAKQVGDQSPTRYEYNRIGLVTRLVQPDGGAVQVAYNEAGRPIRITDAAGRTTRYEYDGLSQVCRKIDPLGQVFTYEYDAERNLIGLINEKGERYQLAYDKNERLIEEIGFDGRRQQYRYDPAGQLIEQIERWRQKDQDATLITRFERDPLGRLLKRTDADGDTTEFGYDPLGRLTSAQNAVSTLAFAYDPLGNLLDESQNDQAIKHAYDLVGNRIETTLPDGQVLSYHHDSLGQYDRIDWNGTLLMRLERDTLGREIARQQGSLFSQFQYDPAGRLQRHRVVHSQSKATLIQRNYGYNAQGALSLIQDIKKGDTRFHYDALERLTQVEGYIQEQFQFDPAGNLLGYQANNQNMADSGQSRGNRLAFFGDRKFEYDERGNLIRERRGKDGRLVTHYQYNAANQLVAVEKDGRRTEYRYDPLGRRIAKIGPDSTTNFLWNGDVLAWEQKGPDKTLYVYEPNSFRPLAQIRNGDVYHYHLDHLGTPQELTDANGNLAWSVRYRAYGNVVRKEVEFVENNLRFQGQYYDGESGLHYNRFRYYDPGTGQFTTQDPIGLLGGANNYAYAKNPIDWTDPFGLKAKDCHGNKHLDSRSEAFREAKRDLGIPMGQRPLEVKHVNMTDINGRNILSADRLPIRTREYHFTRPDGTRVVIQEHSAGHVQFDGEAAGMPHFNIRPYNPLTGNGHRTGKVEGTAGHYTF